MAPGVDRRHACIAATARRIEARGRDGMKGHIRERSPGHWAIVIDVYDGQGKRRRKWHSFKGTKREAQAECSRLITESKRGGVGIEPGRMTVTECLDRWLAHIRTQVSPRTHECYGETV